MITPTVPITKRRQLPESHRYKEFTRRVGELINGLVQDLPEDENCPDDIAEELAQGMIKLMRAQRHFVNAVYLSTNMNHKGLGNNNE